jgi:predicted dehydrogenase
MKNGIRWGILGAGIIAHRLAEAVTMVPGHELVAVASKTPAKAADFARHHGICAATYDGLLADATIDVVYVATTHNFHHACARAALEHGKHVLVEKPVTVNAAELQDLVDLARERGCFLMEAMWTRFLPTWQRLRAVVESGELGDLRHLDLVFGGIVPPHYERRLKDPALAGGVTLDMGVYPLAYACHVVGELPDDVLSMMRPHPTGVDELACYLLRFPGGGLATISTSFDLVMPARAALHGTRALIEHPDFMAGDVFHVRRHGDTGAGPTADEVRVPHEENGFVYQVREVGRCLAEGALESTVHPLRDSLGIMQIMDAMRRAWGLRYPGE